MKMSWEDFENDCTKYLNTNFGKYANFIHEGGSNSTLSDIEVIRKRGGNFYIEAKLCPAQCGQFVLLPDITYSRFVYSLKNTTPINSSAKKIMGYMNQYFEDFKEAGTAGKEILMDNGQEIFSEWITGYYKNKGTKYFITNNYILLPIEEFSDCFNVTADYRVKRSGSADVGKRNMPNVISYINTHDYLIENTRKDKSKLFVKSSKSLHNRRFLLEGYEYMFSIRGSEYEIRKLSNTFNANVIFSIDLKPNRVGITQEEFIQALI